jgi:DNA polymerase elongation subunit (family B)
MGTVGIWDSLIHKTLWKQKIIVPPNKQSFKQEYEGGYVKPPQCGVHDWVVSFDVNSLYPNIIVQWNMSPETILKNRIVPGVSIESLLDGKQPNVKQLGLDNVSVAATGQCFDNSKHGFMPKIIEEMYAERVTIKNAMLTKKKEYEQLKEELNNLQ